MFMCAVKLHIGGWLFLCVVGQFVWLQSEVAATQLPPKLQPIRWEAPH